LREIALIALIAERPKLAGAVSMVEKILRDVVDVPERIARRGERRVVIPVQKNHRHVRVGTAFSAEADDRQSKIVIRDDGKIVRKRSADLRGTVGRIRGRAKRDRKQQNGNSKATHATDHGFVREVTKNNAAALRA